MHKDWLSRLTQQKRAIAKNKELASRTRVNSGKDSDLADKELASPSVEESPPRPEFNVQGAQPASIGMRLYADDGRSLIKPIGALQQLAGQLLLSKESGRSQVSILWPGSIRSLGLVHAIATAAAWQTGNKAGIRTLVYPAKANFLQALNHAHIDRHALVALAQALYEEQGRENQKVTVQLAAKDPFWFSLNSIKVENGDSINPSFAELLPHFFADKEFKKWRACDGDLLRHIRARLRSRHRTALGELTIRGLSDPSSAPDALFAISWRATREDIEHALEQLQHWKAPDVIVLDATRALRRDNPGWKNNLLRFIKTLHNTWQVPAPILVVTDEPYVRNHLLVELEKRSQKGDESAAIVLQSGLPLLGIVCTTARGELVPDDFREPVAPTPKALRVEIVDTEAAKLIALLDRLRSDVTKPEWRQPLDSASSFLSRLTALPSSTRVLVNWLNEADIPMAVRGHYSWPVYRSQLEQLMHDPEFDDGPRLAKIITKGDEIWHAYENGTPLARKLANLIEEHTRGLEKCCVAFTRPTARRLSERYFETYDGYPPDAGFEVLRDSVRFVVSRELDASFHLSGQETLILAGLDDESLRLIMLDERISSPTYLLLTRRNAAYLKATLRAISGIPGLSALLPRIDELINQLPEFPDLSDAYLATHADFVLPTFSFDQSFATSIPDNEDSDPTAWTITFEDGRSIRRGPQSRIYLYDPALSHTPTRGFRGVAISELQEGDHVFLMSYELRELTESALKIAGIPITTDGRFENVLRKYHALVAELASQLPGTSLVEKAREVFGRIRDILDKNTQMPAESTVKAWLDVERFRSVSFEDAKPGAPRHEAHFGAFAKALGMDDFKAIYFWNAVIRPLRGARRSDGRRIFDAYTEMLFEPESVVVHRSLPPMTVSNLFSRAKENVYVVESISRPNGGSANE
ncbi:MAG TPA: hypothetical protein VGO35_00550 [Gammaproteobacteria bacterium]|jgi:hypothetical protein|nr:hypothetical protein [Gammaproteobacteria bacterium]